MRKEEVQCYTCKNCMEILGEEEYAASIFCKLREVGIEADGANRYDYRLKKYGRGYAHISVPLEPCSYHSEATPLPPEPKLIHSPSNWWNYRKVKE